MEFRVVMLGLHHDTLETAGGGRGFHGLRQGSERIHARADRTNVEQSVAQQVKQPLAGVSRVHELANDPPVVSSAEPQGEIDISGVCWWSEQRQSYDTPSVIRTRSPSYSPKSPPSLLRSPLPTSRRASPGRS